MDKMLREYELSLYVDLKAILENKVYIVTHSVTDELYIKKILKKEFLDIYKTLKDMENKNRVKIIDYFEVDDKLIVIEELINGRTIENILMNEGVSEDEAIRIIVSICDGLRDIHFMDKPLIHRDIKPSNIMMMSDGSIKVIDFDAARLSNDTNTRDTVIIGTANYASPEQFGFAQTDNRSDIYSMGVLLNYMIVKKYPMQQIADGQIGKIIKKAIQIDREYRYKDVDELREELLSLNSESINQKNNEFSTNKNEILNLDKKEKENKKEENLEKQNNNSSFIKNLFSDIPGFRRKNILFELLAGFWYLVAIVGFAEFIVKFQREDLVVSIYMVVLPIMVLGKGFGLNKYIPIINGDKKSKKILAKIVYAFIITLIAGAAMGPTTV